MLVHIVARPLIGSSQLEGPVLGLLADGLRAAGSEVIQDVSDGVFPIPIPVPDPDACAKARGHVVTLARGACLGTLIDSMSRWAPTPLVVLTELSPRQVAEAHDRASHLGVLDRIDFRPGLRGRAREGAWAGAALVVAGSDTARTGAPILEAAARGVPAVALAIDANLDHVVGGITGVLVGLRPDARLVGSAVAALLEDPFRARAMGMSALDRVRTLHSAQRAGERLSSMYHEAVGGTGVSTEHEAPGAGIGDQRVVDSEALTLEHLSLARQLAGWYAGRGQRPDDLTQVAFVGLVPAAGRFDPSRGEEFHSFAVPTILGELRKHFRDNAWAVRVPRDLQETKPRVHRATEALQQSLGRVATVGELADELGLVEQEVAHAVSADSEDNISESRDRPVDGEQSVADFLGDPDPALDLADVRSDLRVALARLPQREQEILLLRFFADRTQSEIAKHLGMSQVHVSRVLSRALAVLHDDLLGDKPLPGTASTPVVIPGPRVAVRSEPGAPPGPRAGEPDPRGRNRSLVTR